MDFSTYKTGVAVENASLRIGHLAQALFALCGFSSSLRAEHPEQGIEKMIPEFTALEAAEASGRLADPGTTKGQQQRVDLANAQDAADSAAAGSAGAPGMDIGKSLTSEGLDGDTPVFLMIELAREATDVKGSYNVGRLMHKYQEDLHAGNAIAALKNLYGNAANDFKLLSAFELTFDVLSKLPGVNQAVLGGLPK